MNLSNNAAEDDFTDVSKLSWECISPVIMTVRGKNPDIKNDAYRTLNDGQKAVFSFHVYYDHAKKDPESFVYWSRLYLQMNFFGEIKKGALYFANQDYANLLTEIEGCLTGKNSTDPHRLYMQLRSIGEEHITRMGRVIEGNRPYFFTC